MKGLSNFLEKLKTKPKEISDTANEFLNSVENKKIQKGETSFSNEPVSEENKAIKNAEEAVEKFKGNIRKAFGGK